VAECIALPVVQGGGGEVLLRGAEGFISVALGLVADVPAGGPEAVAGLGAAGGVAAGGEGGGGISCGWEGACGGGRCDEEEELSDAGEELHCCCGGWYWEYIYKKSDFLSKKGKECKV